jgi:hypothetical protein
MCLATVPPGPVSEPAVINPQPLGGGVLVTRNKKERQLGEADARGTAWAIHIGKKAEARWFMGETGTICGFLCDVQVAVP